MLTVTLYTRQGCELCDQVLRDLESLQSTLPHSVSIVDIDADPDLRKQLGEQVPVVQIGPYRLKAPITLDDLKISLSAYQYSLEERSTLEQAVALNVPMPGEKWSRSDGYSYWFSKHYLAVLNVLVALYIGIAFLAPLLMEAGVIGPAALIYKGYSAVCHQLAYRSFFVFGEQYAYPAKAAGVTSLISYEQATGLNPSNYYEARAFEGTQLLGFKIAICERCFAIYASILLFGLLFALVRRKGPRVHWLVWVVLAIIPIGLDGGSQYISQIFPGLLVFRESTPLLRVLTGSLFGFVSAWFAYPYMEEEMAVSIEFMDRKLARLKLVAGRG